MTKRQQDEKNHLHKSRFHSQVVEKTIKDEETSAEIINQKLNDLEVITKEPEIIN